VTRPDPFQNGWIGALTVGFVRERPGTNSGTRYQALYDDVKGHRRSAGTFVTQVEAVRAWQRAEDRQADGRSSDTRRTRQRFARYVEEQWLPHHEMEARTRETYTYYLNKHILPVFGSMRINEIHPADVREWVSDLKTAGASPTVIRQCYTILSAVFTTAFNDQLTRLHPCRGVKTPPVAKKLRTIITPDQFDQLYTALPTQPARLLAEVLIESGLRWAELIELHPADLNPRMRMLTVSRVAVELVAKFHPTGGRFLIKDYPKDREHRRVKLAPHIADQLHTHITDHALAPDDLLFTPTLLLPPPPPDHPRLWAEPADLGLTEPNAAGRQYRHGTLTGYNPGRCKCEHCRGAYATYRAQRRAAGKDPHPAPRSTRSRTLTTDGHIPRSWYRHHIWNPALLAAGLGIQVRTHDLRHAHASWLLAGGADLQTVKERLGHGSIITTEKYLHTLAETDDTALTALATIRNSHRT
jgi:site-specific recombinase XerD